MNAVEAPAPPSVSSARAYLRDQLPGVFRDDPEAFALGCLEALETVLDPIFAILDALPAYVDPWLPPPALVELLAAWLGESLDQSWSLERRRRLVAEALPLARRRGTRAGLEAALELAFPQVTLEVDDAPGQVVVRCDAALDDTERRAVERLVNRLKPVHVRAEVKGR
jgi:phage tail-like protein